jgi:arylsulfatase
METVDDETVAAAIEFIRAREKDGTPWFVWWNGMRMHFRTHVSEERRPWPIRPLANTSTSTPPA